MCPVCCAFSYLLLVHLNYYFYLLLLAACVLFVLVVVVSLFHMAGICGIISFVRPILETVAAHCGLPPPSHLCEVDGMGISLLD